MIAVAAVDRNFGIGKNGRLPAEIPADLRRFRSLTTGGVVIMGRKTYEGLPKRPLPGRENIVLTASRESFPGARRARSAAELFSLIREEKRTVFLCGGGSVYEQLLPCCETAYLTEIDAVFESDVFFPPIGSLSEWIRIGESAPVESNGFTIRFTVWKNRAVLPLCRLRQADCARRNQI